MELTSSSDLRVLNMGVTATYMSGFSATPTFAKQLATLKTSTHGENKQLYFGALPRMVEWVGERTAAQISSYEHTTKNKDWQQTVPIDRNDILDDNLGKYTELLADLGRAAALLWDDIVGDLLGVAESTLTYDNQYFFDTDHPVDPAIASSPTQSNLFTSRPLTDDNYAYVRARMRSLVGTDGRKIRVNPNALIVGPELEVPAKRIVQSNTSAVSGSQVDNVQKGTAEVIVFPEITGTDWILADLTNVIKPFVVYKRQEPRFVPLDALTDHNVFYKRQFVYGVDGRGVGTFGPWFLAAKAKA